MSPKRRKVLIVEDDPLLLELFATALERTGIEALPLESSLKAFELLEDLRFDAIISDVHLEPFDGFEIARVAREKNSGIPVILVTGKAEPKDFTLAADEGLSLFTKPISLDLLIRHLEVLCKARRNASTVDNSH